MKIQMDLTERDKKLLYVLGLVIIIALFALLAIRPLLTSLSDKETEITAAEETKQVLATKRMTLPSVTANVTKMSEEVNSYSQKYYAMMTSSEIDKLITGYVLSNGLTSRDLAITMPTAALTLTPYQYSEAAKADAAAKATESATESQYNMNDATDSAAQAALAAGNMADSTDDSTLTVNDTNVAGVYAAELTLKVEGNREIEQLMLDDIQTNYPSMRVTAYSWNKSDTVATQTDSGIVYTGSTEVLNLNIELYMYDPNAYVSTTDSASTTDSTSTTGS
ncbi:MAG TPA: hypothetical protein PLN48_08555 [Lachnospiraceae bacterium]|nr:hypothetical protein [Lachnospiraceae bacterium]